MLVLSRKTSERITIGKDIVITVVEIRGNKVRLGIKAPRNVAVDREEVAELKQCEAFLESLNSPQCDDELADSAGSDPGAWESDQTQGLRDAGFDIYETTLNPTSLLSAGSPL